MSNVRKEGLLFPPFINCLNVYVSEPSLYKIKRIKPLVGNLLESGLNYH